MQITSINPPVANTQTGSDTMVTKQTTDKAFSSVTKMVLEPQHERRVVPPLECRKPEWHFPSLRKSANNFPRRFHTPELAKQIGCDWVLKWSGIWTNFSEQMLCYALLSSDWQLAGDRECQVHLAVAPCTHACAPPPHSESKSLVFSLQELESAGESCLQAIAEVSRMMFCLVRLTAPQHRASIPNVFEDFPPFTRIDPQERLLKHVRTPCNTEWLTSRNKSAVAHGRHPVQRDIFLIFCNWKGLGKVIKK